MIWVILMIAFGVLVAVAALPLVIMAARVWWGLMKDAWKKSL